MKNKYAVIIDPKNDFFPGHKVHGRIGIVSKDGYYGAIKIKWQPGDKFIGNYVNIPFYTKTEVKHVFPIDMTRNLYRLVYEY